MSRRMQSGAFPMLYNIYVDPARTLIWGDGTGGSSVRTVVKAKEGRLDFSTTAYGRVPPLQSVAAGVYSDDVLVTVYF